MIILPPFQNNGPLSLPLGQQSLPASLDPTPCVPVPPEPEASDNDAVRIQFRLPDGNRVVRRFRKTDAVGGVFSFVKEKSAGSGTLELRAGFPPVDLSTKRSQNIDEAKLSGESIQCRYV